MTRESTLRKVTNLRFLRSLGIIKWKQSFLLGASVTKQTNSALGEPVRIESKYGLEELKNNNACNIISMVVHQFPLLDMGCSCFTVNEKNNK